MKVAPRHPSPRPKQYGGTACFLSESNQLRGNSGNSELVHNERRTAMEGALPHSGPTPNR